MSTPFRIDGAFDGHAHVFSRDGALAPGRRYTPSADAPVATYLAHLDRFGLNGALLVQPSFLGADNAQMLAAIAAYPARFRGVAVVDDDAGLEKLKALKTAGVVGLRFNRIGDGAAARLRPAERTLAAHCAELGLHVELHVAATALAAILPPLRDLGVAIVIDHFGRPATLDDGLDALAPADGARRTWVKLSAAYRCPGVDPSARTTRLCDLLGPDRLIWGSDWPHTQYERDVDFATAFGAAASWAAPDEAMGAGLAALLRETA